MILMPIEVWMLEEHERRSRQGMKIVRGAGRRARKIAEAIDSGEVMRGVIEGQLAIGVERAERLGLVDVEDSKST